MESALPHRVPLWEMTAKAVRSLVLKADPGPVPFPPSPDLLHSEETVKTDLGAKEKPPPAPQSWPAQCVFCCACQITGHNNTESQQWRAHEETEQMTVTRHPIFHFAFYWEERPLKKHCTVWLPAQTLTCRSWGYSAFSCIFFIYFFFLLNPDFYSVHNNLNWHTQNTIPNTQNPQSVYVIASVNVCKVNSAIQNSALLQNVSI